MDASALDQAISVLEQDLSGLEVYTDKLEFWLTVSTWAVVVGVALELLIIVKEHLDARAAWRDGSIRSPEKPLIWFFTFQMFATLLITVGVAGELKIGVLAGEANASLRNKSRQLVGFVREKAGNAERDAAFAKLESGRLNQQNLRLQVEVLELREKLADRRLSPNQRMRLKNSLRGFPAQVWQLITYGNDGEAKGLASDIKEALSGTNGAGWPMPTEISVVNVPPVRGLLIEIKNGANSTLQKTAEILASALRTEKLQNVLGPGPFNPFGFVRPSGAGGGFTAMTFGDPLPSIDIPITIAVGRKP